MSEPIRLGFTSGFSGQAYAQMVANQFLGAQMAVAEFNEAGGAEGREIILLKADDAMDQQKAEAVAKKLIFEERAQAIVGAISAASQLGTNKITKLAGVPFVSCSQSNAITTKEHLGPFTFHIAPRPFMFAKLVGRWGVSHLGKRWFFLIPDYTWGYEVFDSLSAEVKKLGGEIVGCLKIPFGATPGDYAKHFPEIRNLKPDVLSVTNLGQDQVSFAEAASKDGLIKDISILLTISDLLIVDQIPLNQLVGMYFGINFYWGLEKTSPISQKFVEGFRERYSGTLPTGYAGYAYDGTKELLTAIKNIGAYPIDPKAITLFLEGRTFNNYKGDEWWRPCDHQNFQDIYILRFKGPEESTAHYDIAEIIDIVRWDLEIELSCEELGHADKKVGHF